MSKFNNRSLTVFSLTMITVVSVDSLRNLPAIALFGTSLLFFFPLALVLFLLPTALVSAELSSTWNQEGGIYLWVKSAFGPKIGALAIWLQWVENLIWYPTLLSFVIGTIAYLIHPELIHHKIFLISLILLSFWGATLLNCFGMQLAVWFSNFCSLFGMMLPMLLIISLGVFWALSPHPNHIHFTWSHLSIHLNNHNLWTSLTAIILSFCGMEIATIHTKETPNPQQAFPRALAYSTLIIVTTLLLGSLSIAVVLPTQTISLIAGIMQTFATFFKLYHLSWITPIIALTLIIGGMGNVSNWIIAPIKGLAVASEDQFLPIFFQKKNRHGVPIVALIVQAIIVSLLTLMFLVFPHINQSYWLLTALAAQLYMIMYILMFMAALKLRYTATDIHRLFRIPGKNYGIWIVCLLGITGCSLTFFVGFIPPQTLHMVNSCYITWLTCGLLLMSLPPLVYRRSINSNFHTVKHISPPKP